MIMKDTKWVFKKLDKQKKKKFTLSTVSYVLKTIFLLWIVIQLCYETIPATSNNTRTITGNVENIEIIENNRMYDVIKITIQGETFPFVWNRFTKRAETLEIISHADSVSVTVKKDRWLFSLKDKYVERVVDIRIDDNVLYDIEYHNKFNFVSFSISIIVIIFFEVVFTEWYYTSVKFYFKEVKRKKKPKNNVQKHTENSVKK